MGFGCLLDIKIDSVPGSLAHFVVDNLDISKMSLEIENGTISINRQAVHDILGLPMGEVNISTMPAKAVSEGEVAYSIKWKDNFGGKKGRSNNVLNLLKHTQLADFDFKLNFLLLVVGTMFGLDKNGGFTVATITSILDSIGDDTDIESLDWCGFLIDQMKCCKDDWPPSKKDYYFCGPTTFLVLLYLDATYCEHSSVKRSRPAISYWNRVCMAERVEAELLANNMFGKLPLQDPYENNDEVLAVKDSLPTNKEVKN